MRYKHKKTGTVIDIPGILTSPDWERIPAPEEKEKAVKPDGRKRVRTGK